MARHALSADSVLEINSFFDAAKLTYSPKGEADVPTQALFRNSYQTLVSAMLHHLPARNAGGDHGVPQPGIWLEFGVNFGFSFNATCALLSARPPAEVHGFDTFTGLPEAWGTMAAGTFSQQGKLPPVRRPCGHLHKGLLNETLPTILRHLQRRLHGSKPFALLGMNVDVDLFDGSVAALRLAAPHLQVGSLVHFHEIAIPRASWAKDETRVQDEARALYQLVRKRPDMLLSLLPVTARAQGQPEEAAAFVVTRAAPPA